MSIAHRLDGLSFFTMADFKTVLSLEGVDMTGVGGNFAFALAPEGPPVLTASVTVVDVIDVDGVPVSVIELFAPLVAVQAAQAAIGASDPGANVPLYYEFRVDRLPGDLGSDAETTLFYGTGPMRGSV